MKKEFHFVLNEKTYEKIFEMKKDKKCSISKTIVDIIVQMTPYLEKHGISFKDEDTRYQKIGEDDEYRKHIHVYMPREMYKRLKKLHLDINYYSMAQILRHVIELFLKDRTNLGIDEHMKSLKKFKRNWELKKQKVMNEGKEFLRQLSINSKQKPVQTVKYDIFFRPIAIRLL